jgi:Raf kinase inhibitor-like YbhB/YbcL family protein
MRYLSILLLAAVTALVSFTTSAGLTVTSTAFANNGTIPSKYSCEGTEVSPALKVENIPANTQSLALIVHDPDAPMPGGFTHWVMWNLSVDGIIPENFKGAEQGLNGSEEPGYKGMCPPTGTHHYHFYVYALNTKLSLGTNTNKADLEKAMQGHILAEGKITGLYKKVK